jgi:hypothetical protein
LFDYDLLKCLEARKRQSFTIRVIDSMAFQSKHCL